MSNAGMMSSQTDNWATPWSVFLPLDKEFRFTLDACAGADNCKVPMYYSKEQDGLAQKWEGMVWMNPPYGRQIGQWVKKAYESAQGGATVVCLLPARTC